MYVYPFEQGVRLPMPRLMAELCRAFDRAPGQFFPQTWRVVCALDALCNRERIPFSVEDLMHTYEVRDFEKGRCTVSQLKGLIPLIVGSSNDRGWQGRYIFVRSESMSPADLPVRSEWNAQGKIMSPV
jgi:hypothetical protein